MKKEEVFIYLDELRLSGVTNMYGASPYLQAKFGMSVKVANGYLLEWMSTFKERHGY